MYSKSKKLFQFFIRNKCKLDKVIHCKKIYSFDNSYYQLSDVFILQNPVNRKQNIAREMDGTHSSGSVIHIKTHTHSSSKQSFKKNLVQPLQAKVCP